MAGYEQQDASDFNWRLEKRVLSDGSLASTNLGVYVINSLASTTGNLINYAGNLYAPSSSLWIGGNYTNSDVFTHSTGTVVLAGTSQQTATGTMTNTSAFYNLQILNNGSASSSNPDVILGASASSTATTTINKASSQVQFKAGSTYQFQNIVFNGQAAGTRVELKSSVASTSWAINVPGTRSVLSSYIEDSNACAVPPDIDASDSSNLCASGNSCWTCPASTNVMRVSGNVFSDEGDTAVTSIVSLVIDGTSAKVSTTTDANGHYAFTGIASTTGETVTLWLDNDGGILGTTVTLANAADISGLNIYKDRLITRHENSGPITNSDIGKCTKNQGSGCSDSDLHFSSSTADISVDNDTRLYLWTGDTYTPGGVLTLKTGGTALSAGGDLKWGASSAVLSMGTNALSVGGDWINSVNGAFTQTSNATTTFNATSTDFVLQGNMTGVNAFQQIEFSGNTASAWTIQNSLTANSTTTSSFLIHNGIVTFGNTGGEKLNILGQMKVANTANEIATFQTASVSNTNNIFVYLNASTSIPDCPNCIITVGATSGTGSSTVIFNKNTIVQLNPRSTAVASDAGIEVESTGYLKILGSQDATNTVSSVTEQAGLATSTITVAGTPWTSNNYINEVIRITNTSSPAFGKIYDISATTSNTVVINASTTALETNPNISGGAACSGNATCTMAFNSNLTLITSNNQQVGRYLHNVTDNKYYQIVATTDGGAASDTVNIVSSKPDAFTTLDDGDDVQISDGILADDIFQILDYAHVTAENGTACNVTVNESGESYIWTKAGSQTLLQYADICNLGRAATNFNGVTADTVNGATANEKFSAIDSRVYKGYYGIYLLSSSNNNTISGNNVYENLVYDILLSSSNNNTLSRNSVYGGDIGLLLSSSNNNTLSLNSVYWDASYSISIESSFNNTLSGNNVYGNTIYGIYLNTSSNNNTISLNSVYGNTSYGIVLESASNNNTLSGNNAYGNDYGIVLGASSQNIFSGNSVYGNMLDGIANFTGSNNNIFSSNQIYGNKYGLTLGNTTANTGNISINDIFSSGTPNSVTDIEATSTGAHTLRLYNSQLLATDEVGSAITTVGSYIVSFDHDSLTTSTKIWGQYSIPSDSASTTQDESKNRFNYANNTWEKSVSPFGYSGTGTGDFNLDFDLSSSVLSGGPYAYRAVNSTAGNCGGVAQFTVYRYASSGVETNVGTASCGSQFTDSSGSVNTKFKIDGGGTAYVVGDTYTFVVWDASNITNTRKYAELQRTNDRIIIPAGTTLESIGGGTGTNQFTYWSLVTGGANTWDLFSNGSNTSTIQESKIDNFQMASGTLSALNTQFTAPSVTTGTLNIDWYFGTHVVDKDATSTNIDTGSTDITITETTGSSTVFKLSSGLWGSGATSQTTGSGTNGQTPEPTTDSAIRIREYSRTPTATSSYKYNVAITATSSYSAYNYYTDYGSNYIGSINNTAETLNIDKIIGNLWYRDTIATQNADAAVNDPPVRGTLEAGMNSPLSFTIDSVSVNLGTLNTSNSFTATASNLLTVSSGNAYEVKAYETDLMKNGTTNVNNWAGTNAAPTTWTDTCLSGASNCGFGYNTNDTDLTQFTSTKYAGFTSSTPGDQVAKSTGAASDDQTTITYRMSIDTSKKSGNYSTTIIYLLLPLF